MHKRKKACKRAAFHEYNACIPYHSMAVRLSDLGCNCMKRNETRNLLMVAFCSRRALRHTVAKPGNDMCTGFEAARPLTF